MTLAEHQNLLVADGVGVHLNTTEVLREITFEIDSGSWVGLIGPNGSGKTTLLRASGGLIDYSGSLQLGGAEVSDWDRSTFARRVAFVRPASSLAFDFRVLDLVMLGRSPRKRWLQPFDARDSEIAAEALESVDLGGFENRSIHTLSSGEQQRVFLAQAMAQEPELLLLDEPTAHLDIHHRFSFLARVRDFVDEGRTAIAAVHDLELACRFADYLLVLDAGRIVGFGPPARVLTSELLEQVFKVRADVTARGDRVEDIRFYGSVERTVS